MKKADPKTKSRKHIAMAGLGYWGKNILRNLSDMGVLAIACDSSAEILRQRQAEFPRLDYTSSFEDALADARVRAVVIATPAVTHYDLARKALNAGKDVFIEKPLALTYKMGRKLLDLSKSGNKVLMVGHILQYHPAVIKLKELVAKGDLGKLEYIYSNRLNIGKLRTEENILWSFAPHDISVILSLTGEEPARVQVFGGNYITQGVHDITVTGLEFRNGVKGHIFVSWLHPYKEQKLIVVGSKGMAVFDDMNEEKLCIYPHGINWINGKIPVAQKAQYYPVPIENKEPLKEELQHFIDCVASRKQPLTDGSEGLRVLRVLELAEKSLKEG
jgi:UDP-2-acetamido-3-amino-2,3-dideoxy-glucuronate N-acetyltransferase